MSAQLATKANPSDDNRLDNMKAVVQFLGEVVVSIETGLAKVHESERRRRPTSKRRIQR